MFLYAGTAYRQTIFDHPMKKTITTTLAFLILAAGIQAQSNDIDKKWRFGLRVTPQPIWLISGDKNNVPSGTSFGTGFGLNMEYRFSTVASFLFGIGGDFEGGKYTFNYDPASNYVVQYVRDADEFVSPDNTSDTRQLCILKSRTVKTTHATIPLLLKLTTAEYNGFRYFGMFGAELGVRVKATANDQYYQVYKFDPITKLPILAASDSEEKDINIAAETSLIPMRFGLNAGLGAEYRLGGTTSMFMSVNFFRSFTGLMKKTADYTYYRAENDGTKTTYSYLKQNLKQSAIRINIGILF